MPQRELNETEKKQTKIALKLAIFFASLLFIDFLITSLIFSYSDWIAILLFSLLFIVPAYFSNAGMVIVGGGKPIDGGRNFRDGRRILGDHKTWKGLIFGPLLIGIPLSIAIFLLFLPLWPLIAEFQKAAAKKDLYKLYIDISFYKYYFIGGNFPIGFYSLIIRIVLCSYGAAIGDLIGSFLKRRFDYHSGSPLWGLDQLDFAIFAILFTTLPAIFYPDLFWIPDLNIIILLLILTPAVSIIANEIAYLIGMKDVPW